MEEVFEWMQSKEAGVGAQDFRESQWKASLSVSEHHFLAFQSHY